MKKAIISIACGITMLAATMVLLAINTGNITADLIKEILRWVTAVAGVIFVINGIRLIK